MGKKTLTKEWKKILNEEGILKEKSGETYVLIKEKNWKKVKELIEDLALLIAIKEGEKSKEISEEEIMKILSE